LSGAEPIARLIGAARRHIAQAVARRVRSHGLNTPRFWILINLREAPGISLRALAQKLRTDEPVTSRIVASLQRQRLVCVAQDPDDRRRHQLNLTARGTALANALAPVAAEVRAGVEAGLDPEEKDTLRGLLARVIENAKRLAQESKP
jgi:MarR family transcriptional regulator for hemolysin